MVEVNLYWSVTANIDRKEKLTLNNIIKKLPEICTIFFKNGIEADLLNIIITDNVQIREINKSFRKKDKNTDVITFPFETNGPDFGPNTAEIYISAEKAQEQSIEQKLTLLHEFIILIVHGLVHAFGYDHERSEQEKIKMKGIETKILDYLNIKDIPPLTN